MQEKTGEDEVLRVNDMNLNSDQKKERMIVLITAAAVLGGILFATGGIFAGWHRIDDHETFRIIKLYRDQHVPMLETIAIYLRGDLNIRWRPLYWIFRVVMPYLFGDHPAVYKLIFCLAGIASYVFLYWSARNLKCSVAFSHLFVLLVLVGRQFEVWYRIGNQENFGILFFAVCLYLLTKQYRDNVFGWKTDILIGVFAVCSGLMKESFLLLLPVVVWLRAGLEAARNLHSPGDIAAILKRNISFAIVLAVIFLLNIYVIVAYVGTNRINYAGLDPSFGIKEYVWAIMRLCKDSLFDYVVLACIILVVALLSQGFLFHSKKAKPDTNRILIFVLLISGGYVIATQMVLHAKSGMWDRYLLPGVIGFAFIFIICTDLLLKDTRQKIVIGCVAAVFLIGRFKLAIVNMSYDYAQEAKAVNQVYDMVLDQTEDGSRIAYAFGNDESDLSFGVFMELKGRPYVYRYNCETKEMVDIFGEHAEQNIPLGEADVFVSWAEDEEESDALVGSYGEWDKVNVMEMYNVYVKK